MFDLCGVDGDERAARGKYNMRESSFLSDGDGIKAAKIDLLEE